MKSVMTRAWELAKAAVVKFGGKVREYFALALRQAWREVRAPKAVLVELRSPNRNSKTWVAAIIGPHAVYKLERKFINSDCFGEYDWTLSDGMYEVCENGKRYFIQVSGGDYCKVEMSVVMSYVVNAA